MAKRSVRSVSINDSPNLCRCPFCGEVPDHYEGEPHPFRRYDSIWRIVHECNTEDSLRIETMYYSTKDDAADAWNRRAQ